MRARLIVLSFVLGALAIAAVSVYLRFQPRPPALSIPIDQHLGKPRPVLAAGYAGSRFVAAWATEEGVAVRPLDEAGSPTVRHLIPELRQVTQILPAGDGALVVGDDQVVRLDANGTPQGPPVSLVGGPPGIYRAYALGADRLAVVTTDPAASPGQVHFRLYDLAGNPGHPLSSLVTIPGGPGRPHEVALVRLGTGEYLLVWIDDGDVPSLVTATIDDQGRVVRDPRTIYQAKPGGSLTSCSAAPTPEGNALVVWQDSSPGPWEILAVRVGSSGPLELAKPVSPDDGRDDLAPGALFSGRRNLVVWQSGIHSGLFERSGRGRVSLVELGASQRVATYDAPGSVEAFSAAAHEDRLVIVAAVPEEWGVGIYGRVLSR